MRMKQYIVLLLMMHIALGLCAQGNGFDMQVMTGQGISGSSRYVGMAGAMAAVGGDVSAVKDNPAALGVFRKSEVNFSLDLQFTQSASDQGNDMYHNWRVPTAAMTFHRSTGNQSGLLDHSFMFSYQRTRTINNDWHTASAGDQYSIGLLMADQARGLQESALQQDYPYGDADLGWLTISGYNTWLIDPVGDAANNWQAVEKYSSSSTLRVSEIGCNDLYTFGWGGNVNNRFYIGLSANVLNLDYEKHSQYAESFPSTSTYNQSCILRNKGVGVNMNLGILYRPTTMLRLALAFQTPSLIAMTTTADVEASSRIVTDVETTDYKSYPSEPFSLRQRRRGPLRAVAGIALQLGEKGILSAEYDYQHGLDTYMTDEHLLKLGGELIIKNHFFINMGYAVDLYGSHRAQKDYMVDFPSALDLATDSCLTTTRVDADFRHYTPRHIASLGFSYRMTHWVFGFAYQFSYQPLYLYGHAYQETTFQKGLGLDIIEQTSNRVETFTNRAVITIAFRY